ncbi:MAG: DNA alkylation repair protein [Bacteroidaceae bacterium]|nr:DNA alkylation repair protein [Bacteroidaceae bacterium]
MCDTPITTPSASVDDTLRHIKQDLRAMMNGVTSHSMRQKGVQYKVNFGVELPRLQNYAEELLSSLSSQFSTPDAQPPSLYPLALRLWNEPIRECRLLAGMLMPAAEMDEQTAELWIEQMRYEEEAECTTLHLLQYMPMASTLAFRWIAREEGMFRLCGHLLMARLFMQGLEPSQRDADEFLDQVATELSTATQEQRTRSTAEGTAESAIRVAPAAYKALLKYMTLSHTAEVRGEELLTRLGL